MKDKSKAKNNMPGQGIWKTIINALLVLVLILAVFSIFENRIKETKDVSLSALATDIKSGLVEKISVEGEKLEITYKPLSGATSSVVGISKKEVESSITDTLSNYGVAPEMLTGINIEIKEPSGFIYWIGALLPFLLPLLFVGFFIWYLTRQVKGSGMQALTFGQSKARMISPGDKKQRVTFADVAGAKEAKEELSEIVDFLKNPKKFLDIGASIPKGILLMGAPGTGKTLLARATAGEAGVAFFSISGSEFVEMFVGVGASRVRDLFMLAKQSAPAIIFIDEIDAVGRTRGAGMGGGNDEREQTLNQILVEMDGFEPTEKVIVMAATNRPDVLDPAILRPGRFDRRVTIDLPDRGDREAILEVQSKGKPLGEDVRIKVIAERTPGFSGADLYSLMNEAAILAAREDRTKLAQYDLIRSIEKVMLGPERKSHVLSKKEKEITAYHEAGHAIVASVLPYADPVHKISIIARGRAAGYTLHLPLDDRKMQSRKEFLDDIAVTLGGYVTEKMIFGDITTGPSNDLQVVSALARDMVTRFGMSDVIGPVALEGSGGKAMFGKGVEDNSLSERLSAQVDEEVKKLIDQGISRATEVIATHKAALVAITKRLVEAETIERDEYESIIIAHGIALKKKQDIEHQT